jgi:hypothetical protein
MLARLSSSPRGLRLAAITAAGVGAALASHAAQAQILEQYLPTDIPGYEGVVGVTVEARPRPDYDYPPVHYAGLTIRPQLTQSLGYNDNVLGTKSPHGSALEETTGAVEASSDTSAATLAGFATFDVLRYLTQSSQDATTGTIGVSGTYNIGRADHVTLAYSHLFEVITATDIGAAAGQINPIPYNVDDVRLSYVLAGGLTTLTPALEYSAYRFSNTTQANATVIETYQNRDLLQGSLTAQYELAPLDDIVGVVRGQNTHYVSPVPTILTSDSNAITGLFGIDFSATGIVRYRLLVGYQAKYYDNPTISNRTSPVFEAGVVWTPTELTTVTGTATRAIEDATADNAIGYTYTTGRLAVDHEYLRNVLLNGHLSYERAEYADGGGTQQIYGVGARVTWLLNRYVRLAATYDYTDSTFGGGTTAVGGALIGGSAGVGGGNYARNLTMLRLIVGRPD